MDRRESYCFSNIKLMKITGWWSLKVFQSFRSRETALRFFFWTQKARRPFRSVANGRAAGGNQWVRRSNFVELWSDMCEITPTGSAGDAQVGQDYTTWWTL